MTIYINVTSYDIYMVHEMAIETTTMHPIKLQPGIINWFTSFDSWARFVGNEIIIITLNVCCI